MGDGPKVTHGFLSFTEVEPGEHQSYNGWHLFDHLPEQLPLPGIAWGQRWVLTPELRPHRDAEPPLDRVHYVTLYLMSEPIEDTVAAFKALGARLHDADRFHLHRTSHLSGALVVQERASATRVLVSDDAVPYRPNTGVHVRLSSGDDERAVAELCELPGVAGVWRFCGDDDVSSPALRELTATWCWLDADPATVAPALASSVVAARFSATFASIDPWGAWDWFDTVR